MYTLAKTFHCCRRHLPSSILGRFVSTNKFIDINEEVRTALEHGKPIVALESTIITHGMPFPDNVTCAKDVEDIVRNQGAIPATIAIVNGRIKVGLTEKELSFLGDTNLSRPIKTSRRDFSYIISQKHNGGTTVSGTMIVANKVGIPIFATGGIGGVHRGASDTFDISADLTELGKCNIAVVSSGVKSILDIAKTLEYLETQGVFVATVGDTNEFPAFYSNTSNCKAPYCVQTAHKAAEIIKCNKDLDMQSGMLFAVPVPDEDSIAAHVINDVIESALNKAKDKMGIVGKEVTPFLLAEVAKITGGKSLQTNMALIKNNAKTAADIAVELSKLMERVEEDPTIHLAVNNDVRGRPMIIGGSNLDCSAMLKEPEIRLDGRLHDSVFTYTAGGVARNICEALCKLGFPPNFLSVVGNDEQGKLLRSLIPQESSQFVKVLDEQNTGQAIVVFDNTGESPCLMGDMNIHKQITPQMIKNHENVIKTAPLIVLDGNLSIPTIETTLELADNYSIPVFYEPTDVVISSKPFETCYWKAVKFISPNFNELRHIGKHLRISPRDSFITPIEEAAFIAKSLVDYIDNVIVTLGSNGILIARKGLATDPFLNHESIESAEISVRHYPIVKKIYNFVNVCGAGDCLAAGIISGMLEGLTEEKCVAVGFISAQAALFSQSAVPKTIINKNHPARNSSATYKPIQM